MNKRSKTPARPPREPRADGPWKRITRLEGTAYHEAGHAAVAFYLRRAVTRVTIVPDEDKGTLGHVRHTALSKALITVFEEGVDERRRDWIEREILIYFAGGLAEKKLTGRMNHVGMGGDVRAVEEWASRICYTPEEARAYVTWLSKRAEALVNDKVVWSCVEAMARELLKAKTLSGRRARQIYRQAIPRLPAEALAALDRTKPTLQGATAVSL
jgi:hypothetical protein